MPKDRSARPFSGSSELFSPSTMNRRMNSWEVAQVRAGQVRGGVASPRLHCVVDAAVFVVEVAHVTEHPDVQIEVSIGESA